MSLTQSTQAQKYITNSLGLKLSGRAIGCSPIGPWFKSVCPLTYFFENIPLLSVKRFGSGGIRTHAPEETGALNQRLRPLGHATLLLDICTIV